MDGGAGDDYVDGGSGNDTLTYNSATGEGDDTLIGGSGNDYFFVDVNSRISAPTLTVSGGTGNDSMYLNSSRQGASITVDMGDGDDEVDFYGGSSGSRYTVGLGDGDDRVEFGASGYGARGDVDLTLGTGRDLVELLHLPEDLTITDFQTGASGDIIRLNLSASLTNWNGSDNLFATGHIRLVQQGADTIIQVDADGGGDSWTTLLTLNNVTASDLTAENFDGFNPDGRSAAQLDKLTSSDENPRWSEIFISLSEASAEEDGLFSMRSMKALPPLHDQGILPLNGDSPDHYTPDELIEPITPLESLDWW